MGEQSWFPDTMSAQVIPESSRAGSAKKLAQRLKRARVAPAIFVLRLEPTL